MYFIHTAYISLKPVHLLQLIYVSMILRSRRVGHVTFSCAR